MRYVYILKWYSTIYDSSGIFGCYSSLKKAKKAIKDNDNEYTYRIISHKVF